MGWVGGGPCDFGVSPSPFGLDFGTLDFGTSDSGLTIQIVHCLSNSCYCSKLSLIKAILIKYFRWGVQLQPSRCNNHYTSTKLLNTSHDSALNSRDAS